MSERDAVSIVHGQEGVLFPSETISREVALERYFTPRPKAEQNTSVRLPQDRVVDLGTVAGKTLLYRPTTPYLNHQIREEYDVDHIRGIGSDLQRFGQLQECGIAAFTNEDSLESYISDSNDFYDLDTDTQDVTRHDRLGLWIVTVYGHNRQLAAAAQNIQTNGHPDRGIQLRAHMHFDPTFLDFLHMQAVENTGQQPPVWNRARSMTRMFELGLRDGQNYSFRQIAECYGVDEDQVWRAHNYVQLPKGVQNLVENGQLPFSGAIELRRLLDVYAEQDVNQLAVEAARNSWSAKQVAGEVAKRVNVRSLPAEFQAFVESDTVKPKQAELIRDMHLAGASDTELREFIFWVTNPDKPPTLNDIREKVAARRSNSRGGQMDIFNGGYDEETAAAERDKVAITQQKLLMGRHISSLFMQIGHIKRLIETGTLVDIIDQQPISNAIRDLDATLIDSTYKIADLADMGSIEELRSLLNRLNGSVPKPLREQLESIVLEVDGLISAEAGTSSSDQMDRIRAARERIKALSPHQQGTLL